MKHCVLLSLLLALGCVHIHGAPVEPAGLEQGSCEDASAKGAAGLALTKINQDRTEGYVFNLHRLSNVHMTKHGENGIVFYLTLDVVETNCSVLDTRKDKICETREIADTPVYGQCKAAIFINKVQRVVRLYKYDCVVRPAPAAKIAEICPDCPFHIALDNDKIQKTVSVSLEKFNSESGLANRFALLRVNRATTGMAMSMYYNVEYTIQETTCPRSTEAVTADKCPHMQCEFAHKGLCKASLFYSPSGDAQTSVECEIFEPEAAEREKTLHLLAGETDHSHSDTDTHNHDHDHPHAADHTHTHDHTHDHTKSHAQHDKTSKHADNSDHHHTHDHGAGSGHRHAHDHSHDHGHGHDHVHAHHAKAHNHTGDSPNHHHDYKHADGVHTHEHDHELALDHDHKHAHLHDHEHHHHHHDHDHESGAHDHPMGMVRMLPSMDQPVPPSPDVPAAGPEVAVTLPLKPDPQIPGEMEPSIQALPTSVSAQCATVVAGETLVEKLFAEDPMFKTAA
ncbi:histidine-rich glycoprotein-like [Chelmon rostratus]|uniref:histidine-rich glycoprotein-like n=1 Tax=Chelmon rostratus TaxID=109905 RepID=UPI001BEA6388|nr:histidine-rich glycoprotein-like [Chelmon rostratus]